MFKFTHATLPNGKRIAFTNETVFLVQIGKGSKGFYKTKYKITGDLYQAMFYYSSLNIGKGFKKRLIGSGLNKPVLLKETS